MSNLGKAYVLALALYSKDKTETLETMADNIYQVVDAMDFGSDDRKADLYAQLIDNLREGTPFEKVVNVIETAMDKTDRRYPHA